MICGEMLVTSKCQTWESVLTADRSEKQNENAEQFPTEENTIKGFDRDFRHKSIDGRLAVSDREHTKEFNGSETGKCRFGKLVKRVRTTRGGQPVSKTGVSPARLQRSIKNLIKSNSDKTIREIITRIYSG